MMQKETKNPSKLVAKWTWQKQSQNKYLPMVKVYQLHLHGVRGGINVEEGDKFCLLGEGSLYKV